MVELVADKDRNQIMEIRSWHTEGTVIIDDFHRLDDLAAQEIADYMKYLADGNGAARKVVAVGIPGSGQKLMKFRYDLGNRIDELKFGPATNEQILEVIKLGEEKLGVSIKRKSDIVLASAGSFHIAQLLCYHICNSAGIEATQPRTTARARRQ